MKYYRVSEVALRALVHASQEIDLLNAAGVDNWSAWAHVPYPADDEVEDEMSMYEEID